MFTRKGFNLTKSDNQTESALKYDKIKINLSAYKLWLNTESCLNSSKFSKTL